MQMLVHYQMTDFANFKSAFDADGEDRGHAGMTVLQLWRENEQSVWALYQISDRKRATEYLDGAAAVFNKAAGVTRADSHILETL